MQLKIPVVLLISIPFVTFYSLYSFGFERDLDTYLSLIKQCESSSFSFSQAVLGIFAFVACNLGFFLFDLIVFLLNILIISRLCVLIKNFLPPIITFLLLLNPLAVSWLFVPSKESFVFFGALLILASRFDRANPLISFLLLLLGEFLILHSRIFLFPLGLFFLAQYLSTDFTLYAKRILSFTYSKAVFIASCVVALIIFSSYYAQELYLTAISASVSLDQSDFSDLHTVRSFPPHIMALINTPIIMLHSFFTDSPFAPIYISINLTLLFLLFKIWKSSSTFILLPAILYILPYSLTLVNTGNASRVLFSATITSLISYHFYIKQGKVVHS